MCRTAAKLLIKAHSVMLKQVLFIEKWSSPVKHHLLTKEACCFYGIFHREADHKICSLQNTSAEPGVCACWEIDRWDLCGDACCIS